MYTVKKRMEIAGAHRLALSYESKCQNLHGHNWIVEVTLQSQELNADGMVMDFSHIKREVHKALDHKYINDVVAPLNPTAENMAKWIADRLGPTCVRVSVQESEGNIAIWEA